MHYLGGMSAFLPASMLALLALAVLVGLRVQRRRRARSDSAGTPPRLNREREWELVVHRAGSALAHAPRMTELQAEATVKIESAEHAYNRLVVDCARLCSVPVEPTQAPMPELPRQAGVTGDDAAADHQPLAA